MSIQSLFAWSKKIHRWLLWFVVVLGLWMMVSGYLMHKELEGEALLALESMLFVRYWHNGLSQYFLVVLLAQMITGLLMWLLPKLLSRKAVSSKVSAPPPQPPTAQ